MMFNGIKLIIKAHKNNIKKEKIIANNVLTKYLYRLMKGKFDFKKIKCFFVLILHHLILNHNHLTMIGLYA